MPTACFYFLLDNLTCWLDRHIPEETVEIDASALAEMIPEHLRKEVEEENKKYLDEKAEHQRRLDTLDLRVFYGNAPTMIQINKSATLLQATVARETSPHDGGWPLTQFYPALKGIGLSRSSCEQGNTPIFRPLAKL